MKRPTPMPTPCREYRGAHDGKGYGWARVERDGVTKYKLVHRLVVERSIGRDLRTEECVMHLCDNPPCFRLDHLKIGTKGENNKDRAAKDRGWRPDGEQHPMAKLTAGQVREIRRRAAAGERRVDLAEKFGVTPSAISNIVLRVSWKSVA